MDKSNTKPKLKPANKYVSKDKFNEMMGKMQDISSSITPLQNGFVHCNKPLEQSDDADVVVPLCHPNSEQLDESQDLQVLQEYTDKILSDMTVYDFNIVLETTFNALLDNRAEANRKAQEERIKKQEEAGIDVITPENALAKCVKIMNDMKNSYDLYKNQKGAIAEEQQQTLKTVNQQADTAKRLETVVGRIEDVQGVKAPKRPPFPSWACLTYMFWHWPMYAFASMWLSKYFRRFCFLITFCVIVLQSYLIFLLTIDNNTMHHDRAKYVTVRNWSFVVGDTATVSRFKHVDWLYDDIEFNKEQIAELNEFIRTKHEQNQKRHKR